VRHLATTWRPGVLLLLLSATNVGLNLVLQFACVLVLGAGLVTDSYFAAQAVPLLLSTILIGSLTNNLTPIAAGLNDDARRAALVFSALLRYGFVALVIFGPLAFTTRWWVPMLFSGLTQDASQIATGLASVFCVIAAMQVLSAITMAGHHAHGRFISVEAVQILASLCALAFVAPVIEKAGIFGFACLLGIRAGAVLIITGFQFVGAKHAMAKDLSAALWTKTTQVLSASIIFKLGPVIDRMIVSFSVPGVLTSLGIGQQMVGASLAITERMMARPLLVAAGVHTGANERGKILSIYYRQLRVMLPIIGVALVAAVAVGLAMLEGGRMFGFLNQRSLGHLDLIALMILTMIPAAAGQLSSALMYALGDIRSINRLAMLSFILSTILKVFGFLAIGPYAIVAGIFLYQSMNWLFLHVVAVRTLRASNNEMKASNT
jgi:putative peptidoglycan lipid II flippase